MTCLDAKCAYILKGPSRLETILITLACPAIGLALAWCVGAWINSKFFPVIKNFEVTSVQIDGRKVTAAGTMTKVKSCELIATNVYAVHGDNRTLVRTFTSKDFGGQLSTGKQAWGPHTIELPHSDIKKVDIVATHKCDLWLQETFYGGFEIKGVEQ